MRRSVPLALHRRMARLEGACQRREGEVEAAMFEVLLQVLTDEELCHLADGLLQQREEGTPLPAATLALYDRAWRQAYDLVGERARAEGLSLLLAARRLSQQGSLRVGVGWESPRAAPSGMAATPSEVMPAWPPEPNG